MITSYRIPKDKLLFVTIHYHPLGSGRRPECHSPECCLPEHQTPENVKCQKIKLQNFLLAEKVIRQKIICQKWSNGRMSQMAENLNGRKFKRQKRIKGKNTYLARQNNRSVLADCTN
uniref:(northern house mosquito) hypothetical protein n=1 Tax=Culex pipiens TaxID=7175 RepID=A0A8D8GGL4_CULPI